MYINLDSQQLQTYKTPSSKGPKHEILIDKLFTQSKPVWEDDLEVHKKFESISQWYLRFGTVTF